MRKNKQLFITNTVISWLHFLVSSNTFLRFVINVIFSKVFTFLQMKLIYEKSTGAETDGWDLENTERFATVPLVITLIKKKSNFPHI
jgi:hypothetical protein